MNRRLATVLGSLLLVTGCASGAPPIADSDPPPSSAPAVTGLAAPATSSFLSESSSAPAVSLPADGEYLCPSKGITICRDGAGDSAVTTLASDTDSTPTSGITVYDPSLSVSAGTVYFRQSERTATGSIETIMRVSTHGGQSSTVVTAAQNNGDEGVELGSPQVSPDGRFLAYVITIGLMGLPSSAIPTPTGALAPLGTHVFVLDVGGGATEPVAVDPSVTGPELPDGFVGYQLVGWSPDDRQLYYFGGPSRDLRALSFDPAGHPVSAQVALHPGAPQGGCPDSPDVSAMTPSGDVLFAIYCQQAPVTIERLHNDHVSIFASLPELTGGWIMQNLIVDTTGRFVQLYAQPLSTHCVSGEAHLTFLDGAAIGKQIQTNPYGCFPLTPP